ncbi:MAG: SWIM zinc finger family protein [Chloroflexi bacterium]|nr:SWIM zinc finger family protein [Chloroflexota bacterium]
MPWSPETGWWEQHGPLLPADGIKARTRRGGFGQSWWASRWIAALERLVNPGRLARGRSYARTGRVLSLDVGRDGVRARVLGTRPEPYQVSIRFATLSDAAWEQVFDQMASQALYAARLLSEEMPETIEDVFAALGTSLFPAEQRDMVTTCSCPDPANPCKHIAAVHYLLGERFDADPFLMFLLRGRDREQLVEALRGRRLGTAPAIAAEPATEETDLRGFWSVSSATGEVALKFAVPDSDALPVKQLGPAPFVRDPAALVEALEATYRAISEAALRLALDDE